MNKGFFKLPFFDWFLFKELVNCLIFMEIDMMFSIFGLLCVEKLNKNFNMEKHGQCYLQQQRCIW